VKKDAKKGHANVMNTSASCSKAMDSEFEVLKGMVIKINSKLEDLEKSLKPTDYVQPARPHSFMQYNPPIRYPSTESSTYSRSNRGRHRGTGVSRGTSGYRGYRGNWPATNNNNCTRQPSQYAPKQEVTCFRCGQIGHIAIGCRVDLDARPYSLNRQGSA
jgi:hypothetical protein